MQKYHVVFWFIRLSTVATCFERKYESQIFEKKSNQKIF
jgi:hypothetical protein